MKINSEVYELGIHEAQTDVGELIQDRKSFTPAYYDEIQAELYILLDWNLNNSTAKVEWKLGYVDGIRNEIIKLQRMVTKIV